VTNPALAEDVVAAPLRVESGHVMVPGGPGLGLAVDERGVRRRQQDFKRVA
jgi:L-alanine-DL-glutamate epimerase-like enolase superfamily enzyme